MFVEVIVCYIIVVFLDRCRLWRCIVASAAVQQGHVSDVSEEEALKQAVWCLSGTMVADLSVL